MHMYIYLTLMEKKLFMYVFHEHAWDCAKQNIAHAEGSRSVATTTKLPNTLLC